MSRRQFSTDIKRVLRVVSILHLFKLDGDVGADLSVVLYESNVCEPLKKEIVAKYLHYYHLEFVAVSAHLIYDKITQLRAAKVSLSILMGAKLFFEGISTH